MIGVSECLKIIDVGSRKQAWQQTVLLFQTKSPKREEKAELYP
jgi:hypothetical protein